MNQPQNLPPKWGALRPGDARKLEPELAREACVGHPLHNTKVEAIYRRYPHDDVLFRVHDSDYPYYCVHLTWSKESDPLWPHITRFRSIEDFCENYEMTREIDSEDPRWTEERWRFYEE